MKWFESLRKWIDGEEDFDEQGEPRPRSKWDDFLVAVAREIEEVMRREMFTPPGGPTYVPREYIVFLSTADDADWQGEKREGLERGLFHVLSERAKELAGENEFQTKTLIVELRVDPSLDSGKFRVQHVWDAEAEKTMVSPRKRAEPSPSSASAQTVAEQPDEEATIVRPRQPVTPSFSVLVRRNAPNADTAPPDIRPFYKDEIAIGRGSRQVAVDLRLEGDLEVSRQHAQITKNGDGQFTVTCKGANSIMVNDEKEVFTNESAAVQPGDRIAICSYELVIQ
ncbi:MAG: FhaA domain-containing protein [Blastocatellia bacterium]